MPNFKGATFIYDHILIKLFKRYEKDIGQVGQKLYEHSEGYIKGGQKLIRDNQGRVKSVEIGIINTLKDGVGELLYKDVSPSKIKKTE